MNVSRTLLLMAFVCAASAQAPHIGNIDFYGLHRVTPQKILQTGRVEPGGALPPSKGELEDQLATIPGVVAVRVEAVCWDGNATDALCLRRTGRFHHRHLLREAAPQRIRSRRGLGQEEDEGQSLRALREPPGNYPTRPR